MVAAEHPRRGRSATSAIIACTLLVSYGGLALHELTATHSVCAEHGEVIEGSAHGQQGIKSSAPSGASVAAAQSAIDIAAAHDHCQAIALRRKPTTASVAAVAVAVSPAVVAAVPAAVESIRAVRALYRLAPKSSPPA